MIEQTELRETITRIEAPAHRYTLLTAADGSYLGVAEDGTVATFDHVDDKAVWDRIGPSGYRHVASGVSLAATDGNGGTCRLRVAGNGTNAGILGAGAAFAPSHGPAEMPSESLRKFREQGWACLAAILAPETVDGLEQVACTGRHAERKPDWRTPGLAQHPAVARTAAEPVSLWLIRQYLQTQHIRLAHPPGMAVLGKDDGERDVQGWHSDFPYLWGITPHVAGNRVPIDPTASLSLSVQRNVCVSEFTRDGGATIFKLGSHARNCAPPRQWGWGADYSRKGYRKEHGLPYGGPEADVVEAPAGSIILYDSRTWHRAGVNRTHHRRAAMLQAMVPMYIMPFSDTSAPYRAFVDSPAANELTDLERKEMQALMVHKIVGPGGAWAITVDKELTEMAKGNGTVAAGKY